MGRATLVLIFLFALPVKACAAQPEFYVSLGDSYATGYQPSGSSKPGGSSGAGFADQLPGLARRRGYDLRLRNFGCGGATTTSLLGRPGCPGADRGAVHPVAYLDTQAAAAERFVRKHRGRIALVTVSIGNNDVAPCLKKRYPITCARRAMRVAGANLRSLLRRLRAAGGRRMRIVGTTYPDVGLARWARGRRADHRYARRSQYAFKHVINPVLKRRYEAAGGTFVDVTKATLGYRSLDDRAPYSLLPRAVARICALTWYCTSRDIHAKRSGYRLIARLVAATLPDRS